MTAGRPAVAVAGVGNMGGAIAARLLERGWTVRVRDPDADRAAALGRLGAAVAATPAEAARGCAALIVCVVDAAQTDAVLFGDAGAAAVLPAGAAVLLCPTIAPAAVEAAAARLEGLGLAAVDAPMSGGPARARDGSMSLMVACSDAAWQAQAGLLATLSSRLFRIGTRPGDGARTKLVNNLLAAINLVGAAEALALAERLGLDPARTLDVIEQSSGQSWIGSDRLRRALAGEQAPRAHMALLAKDTALALQAAQAAGFAGPLGAAAAAVFQDAVAAGWAGADDSAVLARLRGAAP